MKNDEVTYGFVTLEILLVYFSPLQVNVHYFALTMSRNTEILQRRKCFIVVRASSEKQLFLETIVLTFI